MNNIGERIKNLRENKLNMSQVQLADKINVSKQTMYKYENGLITNIPSDKIEAIAKLAKVRPAYIMGWEESEDHSSAPTPLPVSEEVAWLPVYSKIAGGAPIDMTDGYTERVPVTNLRHPEEFFVLQIEGHSMEPGICDGDYVVVHRQPDVESGQIGVISLDGESATCKRIMKYADGIDLISDNDSISGGERLYPTKHLQKEEIENLPVRIYGQVVKLIRDY